ncbi:MAG: DUF4381 domain-containing protein [Gammaproteobacteria bacterium]|nr:DUF4381 domain-containing protein [Gammaproteobacteria bacterium]
MQQNATQPLSAFTPEQQQQLAQLNTIRLPEPVSWWPLAYGWWVLIGVLIVITLIACIMLYRHRRSITTLAIKEIKNLPNNDIEMLTVELSMLIRRFARQRGGRASSSIAHETLIGSEWVDFLSQDGAMEKEIAQYFADAPYQKDFSQAPSATVLKEATKRWVRRYR